MKKKTPFLLSVLYCLNFPATAQVSILSSGFHPMDVTPASMLQVTVSNTQSELTCVAVAELANSSNQPLLTVTSVPFMLKAGVNQFVSNQIKTASVVYGTSAQANFVQAQRTLPSGMYKFCIRITAAGGEYSDEYCDDVQSDFSSFLMLVSPFDKDTIDTKNPLLVWTHSEPFNLLSPGEFFRITVAEILKDQNPESALAANQPVFFRNSLLRHEVQYPFDAKPLEDGKTYAWQVQKMAPGGQTIIDKTEAWQFTINAVTQKDPAKYARVKPTVDGGFYTCTNDVLYFRFDEEYSAVTELRYEISNSNGEKLQAKVEKDRSLAVTDKNVALKITGVNRYELDVTEYQLKKGHYLLTVYNDKNEKFYLKFYVEK